MRQLIIFCVFLLAIPGIAFSQEADNQTAEPQTRKAVQPQKDKGETARVNAAIEYVYSQVMSWTPIFDACTQDATDSIDIVLLYGCKGNIELISKTSDCIKEGLPKKFDIDITKDVCVCKEGRIKFTYNKSDGITIKQKTRIGIVNSNKYCSIYRFKRSHEKTFKSHQEHVKH